jgi:hypothetical protein
MTHELLCYQIRIGSIFALLKLDVVADVQLTKVGAQGPSNLIRTRAPFQ